MLGRGGVQELIREAVVLTIGLFVGQVGSRMNEARRSSNQNSLTIAAHTESIRSINISIDTLRSEVVALRSSDDALAKSVTEASREAEARADRMAEECRRRDDRIESRLEILDEDLRTLTAAQGVIVGQGLTPQRYRRVPRRRAPAGADAGDDDGEGGCPAGHYMPPLDDPNFLARLAAQAAAQPPPDS